MVDMAVGQQDRLDALSVLVVSGIALSLLAMLGGGGARFLQLREKLVTGVIGLMFLGSAAVGKPLIYEWRERPCGASRRLRRSEFEALQVHAGFRRTMMVMTLVWGVGLLADVAVAVVLVFVSGHPAVSARQSDPRLWDDGHAKPLDLCLRPARQAPRRGAPRGG